MTMYMKKALKEMGIRTLILFIGFIVFAILIPTLYLLAKSWIVLSFDPMTEAFSRVSWEGIRTAIIIILLISAGASIAMQPSNPDTDIVD